MLGLLLSALLYRPMFGSLLDAANPKLVQATQAAPVTLHANANDEGCRFGFSAAVFSTHPDHLKPCVQAKKFLISSGVNFQYGAPIEGLPVAISIGKQTVSGFDAKAYRALLTLAGYPATADVSQIDYVRIIGLLIAMTIIVAMVYGPVAAFLVEFFRPTSGTLPCRSRIISVRALSADFCRSSRHGCPCHRAMSSPAFGIR